METSEFLLICNFPEIWKKHSLLNETYLNKAVQDFETKYGELLPNGGTEHWRFGAMLHKLRERPESSELLLLLEAVIQDPDSVMAGTVIKEILAQKNSNLTIFKRALEAINSSKKFHVSESELRACFESKIGPYNI
ncbi:MAG TPA: hypothetical protein PK129_12295 [Cellvibrionaceae bacterium]|nr:hypothetical protein [Cellvibrionaceae bacterium]